MINLNDSTIIKEASFVDAFFGGAIDTISKKVDFKNHPFETLFATLVPAVAFSFSPLLGIFLSFVAASGDGTSAIGAAIDEALGFGENKTPKEISESDISGAADQVTDKYFDSSKLPEVVNDAIKWFQEKFGTQTANAMLEDIRQIKGYVTRNDMLVAISYAECQAGFIKSAWGKPTMRQRLRKINKNPYSVKKSGISSILGWIIKAVLRTVGGVIGLGVAGGAIAGGKELLGIGDGTNKPTKTNYPMPENVNIGGDLQTYMNTQHNVANTMVEFLDAEYNFDVNGQKISFSEMFNKKYNVPIQTSPQMQKLLKNIQYCNGNGSLAYISSWRSFNAPELNAVFKLFFPSLPIPTESETINTSAPKKQDPAQLEDLMRKNWTSV